MAATITRLGTRPDKLRRDEAGQLREALLPFMEQYPEQVRDLISRIDSQTASQGKWTFVMLSPSQNATVVRYLRQNSERPLVALELWAMCFEHLRNDTGEIMLTRDQMADKLGQPSRNISRVMGELEKFGAISRYREKVGGLRGPGVARYFMNPNVATHLSGAERDIAQQEAPQLKLALMQGGKKT